MWNPLIPLSGGRNHLVIVRGNLVLLHHLLDIHPEETGLNLIRRTRVHQLYQAETLGHTTGPGPDLGLNQGLILEVPDQDQPLNHHVPKVDQDQVLAPGIKRLFPILHEILQRD